jgi:hypothetical protein
MYSDSDVLDDQLLDETERLVNTYDPNFTTRMVVRTKERNPELTFVVNDSDDAKLTLEALGTVGSAVLCCIVLCFVLFCFVF